LVLVRSFLRALHEPAPAVDEPLRYSDVLCARISPAMTHRSAALIAEHAAQPGPWTALRQVTGMVVRIDTAAMTMTMEVVDPTGGEIFRSPQIVSPDGQAAFRKLQPGDQVTSLFSKHVAAQTTS
jgi:hypothetical protein